jgi:hypothetical protein
MGKALGASLAVMLLLSGCAAMDKAEPAAQSSGGWHVSQRDRNIDLPEMALVRGNFTATITRKYDDEDELELLRIAESVYPSQEDVGAWRQLVQQDGTAASAELAPWSYLALNGVQIPCAVTASAVEYYSQLVSSFEQGDFTSTGGVAVERCRMRYSGVIGHHKWFDIQGRHYPECYVARLELVWAQVCGENCSMAFVKQRLVIMSPQGAVMGVYLDGPTDVVRE